MPAESINSMTVWAPVIAALGSSFLTGTVAVIINHLNKKSELEKVKAQAMISAGADQWKMLFQHKSERNNRSRLFPMEAYILHLYRVSNVIFDPKTTEENIGERLREVSQMNDQATQYWEERYKEKRGID